MVVNGPNDTKYDDATPSGKLKYFMDTIVSSFMAAPQYVSLRPQIHEAIDGCCMELVSMSQDAIVDKFHNISADLLGDNAKFRQKLGEIILNALQGAA